MAIIILGISAFYHDSAAALIVDGEIIASAQEERFSRKKNDSSFPAHAIHYVLEEGGINSEDLTAIAFYDKPLLKFERLLETYHAFVPRGWLSFVSSMPIWVKEKLFIKRLLRKHLRKFGKSNTPILFPEHHLSHAASAYYPSPFEEAAILTIDAVGEWATSTISEGRSNQIKICRELLFPHSVGLLYSAFTFYLGFQVNEGEYKLMGLAPYGDPKSAEKEDFKQKILAEMVDIREDGSILLNMAYFDFATRLRMTNDKKWKELFGLERRRPESEIKQVHMNMALAIQEITETIIIALARTARRITKINNLVMAGGVALNCVANSKLVDAAVFDNIWIQPAAGDAGGALGAAFAVYHINNKMEKKKIAGFDGMKGSFLGPQYVDKDILRVINKYEAVYEYFENFDNLTSVVSQKIAEGSVVGWFQGRMELGPRALGNRSIVADPRNPEMQKIINSKIKSRESFRPFAPSILEEDISLLFDSNSQSPYMLFVKSLRAEFRRQEPDNYMELNLLDRLYHLRSDIPAVTHVDYSARVQTVDKERNPKFWQLINNFKKITGCIAMINTSFNVRDEPIVCSPKDAYLDFMRTELDYLVIGDYLFDKKKQKQISLEILREDNFR